MDLYRGDDNIPSKVYAIDGEEDAYVSVDNDYISFSLGGNSFDKDGVEVTINKENLSISLSSFGFNPGGMGGADMKASFGGFGFDKLVKEHPDVAEQIKTVLEGVDDPSVRDLAAKINLPMQPDTPAVPIRAPVFQP